MSRHDRPAGKPLLPDVYSGAISFAPPHMPYGAGADADGYCPYFRRARQQWRGLATDCPRTLPMPSFVRPPHTAAHVADSFPAARRTPRCKSACAFLSVRFHRRACSTKEIRIRLCELLTQHFAYRASHPHTPLILFSSHSQHSPALKRLSTQLPASIAHATFARPPQCSRIRSTSFRNIQGFPAAKATARFSPCNFHCRSAP